ncbi:MAG: 23S rRNA pseudouridine1911/1915/1917 synthase [Saprospiraceae bacterium]|jgi:23S rRNA pseudouridine1911/1915/1917 synthase
MEVLHEDNHIIIVNKLSGEISQGDKTGDRTLSDKVKAYIKKKYKKPGDVYLGTTHRLDRPVSGAIIFAKTSKALTRLNAMFQEKKIQKTYWALCIEKPYPTEGKLIHYLVKDSKKNKTTAHQKEVNNSKRSELNYKFLKNMGNNYLVEVDPRTGRPHQIRVQLTSIGAIIKGDLKYGAMLPNNDKSICLHARKLVFVHPVSKEEITVIAPLVNAAVWK